MGGDPDPELEVLEGCFGELFGIGIGCFVGIPLVIAFGFLAVMIAGLWNTALGIGLLLIAIAVVGALAFSGRKDEKGGE